MSSEESLYDTDQENDKREKKVPATKKKKLNKNTERNGKNNSLG